jgi:hypothetical protein
LVLKEISYIDCIRKEKIMSGGTFDYNQRRIRDIADRVEHEIALSGTPKTERELKEDYPWKDETYFEKYPEDKFHYAYPEEIIAEFKKGYEILRKAEIYAQRMDWLIACDDGNESFLERLKEELDILDFELSVKKFTREEEDED